jgi:glycosyltransferase involved in cell wall biosynthesis
MKALVISHTPHYRKGGALAGWGPTVREIDALSGLFEELTHLAPVHNGPAPESSLKYQSPKVHVVPVPAAGGDSFLAKARLLILLPLYIAALLREIRRADWVHVRCPSNLGFLAILLLSLLPSPKPRWIKYAGNWRPQSGDSLSCKIQRGLLSQNFARGWVTINGTWPGQPRHIRSFLNPSMTAEEYSGARTRAEAKQMTHPLRLVYAGWLDESKGVDTVLEALAMLRKKGVDVSLDVVGGGKRQDHFEKKAQALNVRDRVRFHGWVPHGEIGRYYEPAHFVIFPSWNEGWPKVLSEAMAYGAVPLAGRVSCIPQYLESFQTGKTFSPQDAAAFAAAIEDYAANPGKWKKESHKAAEAAEKFTYGAYLKAVKTLLENGYDA